MIQLKASTSEITPKEKKKVRRTHGMHSAERPEEIMMLSERVNFGKDAVGSIPPALGNITDVLYPDPVPGSNRR